MATKYICDRCEKETDELFSFHFKQGISDLTRKPEFCSNCRDDVSNKIIEIIEEKI